MKITVRQVGSGGGDVLVCALWNDRSTCDEDGYHSHNDGWRGDNDHNDVQVEFVVRLPAGVKIDASTVNGGVTVDGVDVDRRGAHGEWRNRRPVHRRCRDARAPPTAT